MWRHGLLLSLMSLLPGLLLASEPDRARQSELRQLLLHDCGSCHGLQLKGGLGPALLPQALHGKPAGYLAATILQGRPGTPMPPWQPFLSQEEALWLAQQLKGNTP